MGTKSIKISEENYRWLNQIVGKIRLETGESASIDRALSSLKDKKKPDIMKFAGVWSDMTDKEADGLKKSMKQMWKKWKNPSF